MLHVPFTYWPDPVGGTEVYVRSLADALAALGLSSAVAAPAAIASSDDGAGVFRWAMAHEIADGALGRPDPASAQAFRMLLDRLSPRIVHLHARTSAVSSLLLAEAHAAGARTVFTYHTPTVTCMRGTMMRPGSVPCDGRLDAARCTACVLEKHGVPRPAASMLASAPVGLGRALGRLGLRRGPWLALRMRQLVEDFHRDAMRFLSEADRVVAVCDWVADVLRRNGVAEPQLVLSRQGLPGEASGPGAAAVALPSRPAGGPLRIACFGRLSPEKGIDVLIRSLNGRTDVTLDVFGVAQSASDAYAAELGELARGSDAVTFRGGVPPESVVGHMAAFDLVAVPSVWLETGPLVVLEAFAAGVPVIGSRLGGIAELVRDGVDGHLIPAGDVAAWARAIAHLAQDRTTFDRLKAGVRPPRTMRDAAADMSRLYDDLLAEAPQAA